MATYVNDLRLKEIATGDESGTWGTSTNTNLELIAEAFSFGTEAITTNADTHTTTIADGSTDPGRSMFLKYTGTLDSTCTITIGPNTVSKLWFIENATSGSQNIIIKQGSGATITVPNGQVKAIYSDGAGSGGAMVDAFQDLSVPDLFIDDDLTVGDDLTFTSDSAVITFGADGDTTLTHTDGSGLTLNSTNKIMFNDASQFIQGSSATVLALGATDEIDLTATAIDVNGTMDVSGALTGTTATLTTADNLTQLTLKSTDDDANAGPVFDLVRDSASPADNDAIGRIRFRADNDAGEETTMVYFQTYLRDASDGTEDAGLDLFAKLSGTLRRRITLSSTEAVFNEDSRNLDFRVESDGNTHMLFVDAENDRVGIGASAPSTELEVSGDITASSSGPSIFLTDTDNNPDYQIKNGNGTLRIIDATNSHDRVNCSSTETILNESSADLDFRVESDSNTHMLFVDAGENKVSMGTATAPDGNASVLSLKGADPSHNYDGQLIIHGSATSGAADTGAGIGFKGHHGTGNRNLGAIQNLKENGTSGNIDTFMRFVTRSNSGGLAEAARLTSAGTLLVGKTADDNSVGFKTNTSSTYMVANTATPTFINRLGNVGDLLEFRQDSSTVGSIGTVSGSLSLGSGDCYLEMSGTGNVIQPMGSVTGAASDGAIDLGASGRRFKDLYLSGGVYLGGTGSANELSDYEEGTWTPAVVTSGYTLSSASGKYTKVGRLVTVHFIVRFSAVGTQNSSCTFSGQPFESTTNSIHQPGMARETDTTGAIYVLQANHTSDRIAMNSMDGVSNDTQRTIRTNENYNCFLCYTTQA